MADNDKPFTEVLKKSYNLRTRKDLEEWASLVSRPGYGSKSEVAWMLLRIDSLIEQRTDLRQKRDDLQKQVDRLERTTVPIDKYNGVVAMLARAEGREPDGNG